jgi:hypothetical protein
MSKTTKQSCIDEKITTLLLVARNDDIKTFNTFVPVKSSKFLNSKYQTQVFTLRTKN